MKLNLTIFLIIFILCILTPSSYVSAQTQEQLKDWAKRRAVPANKVSPGSSSTEDQLKDWTNRRLPPKPPVVPTAKPVVPNASCTGEVSSTTTSGINSISNTCNNGNISTTNTTGGNGSASTTTTTGGNSVSATNGSSEVNITNTSGTNEVSATNGSSEVNITNNTVSATNGSSEVNITNTSGTSEVTTTTDSGTSEVITAEQHAANLKYVKDTYKSLVNKDPEEKLLNFLTNSLDCGAFTKEQVVMAIKASDEYHEAHQGLRME